MNIFFRNVLVLCSLLVGFQVAANDKTSILNSEFNNLSSWFAINRYDIAVLYSIFFISHEDPNNKTIKITAVRQDLIEDGIPFATLAYAKVAHSKQVNKVLEFFNGVDQDARKLIVRFINVSYNGEYIVGAVCLGLFVSLILTNL